MIELGRILCPVDRSPASGRALDYAIMLARQYGSALTVLEVIWPTVPPITTGGPTGISPIQVDDFRRDLQHFVEAHAPGSLDVDIRVVVGRVAGEILDQAAAIDAHLMVLGTHGHSGFERLLLGSIAEKVLRKSTRPVMTIPPAAPHAPSRPEPFQSILCAVDFSPASTRALSHAVRLAAEAGRRLTLVHVFDWDEDRLLPEQFDPGTRQIREEHRAATIERLRALVPEDVRVWCDCREMTATGRPYEELVRTAEAIDADLLVMGAHGRRARDLLLFGSTATQVVRHATCPVLTLRA